MTSILARSGSRNNWNGCLVSSTFRSYVFSYDPSTEEGAEEKGAYA